MNKIQLIESHQINRNNQFYDECNHLTYLAKNLWNATNYRVRQQLFVTGEYMNYNTVNYKFAHENQSDYRALPAKISQGVQRMLDKSYKGFFKGTGFRHIPGYLHKTKGRQTVPYPKDALSFKIKGFVKLSKTNILIKTDKHAEFARIVPHKGYFTIEIGYSVNLPAPSQTTGKVATIDFGMKNFATVTSNTSAPFIINGSPIQAINRYADYLVAKQRLHVNGTSHLIHSIYRKRHNKLKDYLHKSSRFLTNWLHNNDITTLVIGYNLGWKKGKQMKFFQKTPYKQFVDMVTYKCELLGINIIMQEESYTSKASFKSLDTIPTISDKTNKTFSGKRIKRGLYKNADNTLINADVNGSLNILRKSEVWDNQMYNDCLTHSKQPIIRYNF